MGRITMEHVAKAAGVSKSTVSQFLNKRYEYMSDETRLKIKAAIDKLGYQPNYIARSLKQKRTSTIAIIVANIVHRFSTEVCRAIEDYCHEFDMHAIICNADDNPVKEKRYVEMLRAKQVDGLILFPTGQNMDMYQSMVEEGYPLVFIDRRLEGIDVPSVVVNNEQSTEEAIGHLIDKGHRKIAIITQPLTISTRAERVAGYKKALNKYGLPIDERYMISGKISELNDKLQRLFQLDDPPTALLAGNDLVFMEVFQFLRNKKISIPGQVSLIVFDNIPFAHFSEPPITTIAQPAYQMGKKAAEVLMRLIEKEPLAPRQYVFPCELIIRESSS